MIEGCLRTELASDFAEKLQFIGTAASPAQGSIKQRPRGDWNTLLPSTHLAFKFIESVETIGTLVLLAKY